MFSIEVEKVWVPPGIGCLDKVDGRLGQYYNPQTMGYAKDIGHPQKSIIKKVIFIKSLKNTIKLIKNNFY